MPRLKLVETFSSPGKSPRSFDLWILRIPHIPKALAMWALCLTHVLLLSRFSAPTIESRKWRDRLNCLNLSPEAYTYPFFNLNAQFTSTFHFIRLIRLILCTDSITAWPFLCRLGISASKRDFNRAAKLKQLGRILYLLSLHTRSSYETCQRIRSGKFHTLEVYAFYKLSVQLSTHGMTLLSLKGSSSQKPWHKK